MKIHKPSHGTVVAYLALFAALGGSAIAARDDHGAKELKQLVVREKSFSPTAQGGLATVAARCKKGEQFISGGGGWERENAGAPAPTMSRAVATTRKRSRPSGFIVQGRAPALDNRLVAQALCLLK